MATTKKAAKKKVAKKAVPKVEEPKQIILTQEQYDTLVDIKSELSTLSWEIGRVFSDEDKNVREVAFEIGTAQSKLDKQQSRLDDITTAVDPNPYVWEPDEDDDWSSDDDN